jgi:hypothetical protein
MGMARNRPVNRGVIIMICLNIRVLLNERQKLRIFDKRNPTIRYVSLGFFLTNNLERIPKEDYCNIGYINSLC